jgi:hypothetical protein
MHNIKWLLAAGLIAATTAACTEQYGYPSTSYNNGYYRSGNGYYSNGTYYSNATPSYPNYASSSPRRYGPNGDYDRDGIPNKYDRDANGDGIPDRYQR